LQKTDVKDDDLWKVEKILKTKGKGRHKQYFFNGYIGQANSTRGYLQAMYRI
jgi:hypothetical protein